MTPPREFNPDVPRDALAILDAVVQPGFQLNRSVYVAVDRALATLSRVVDEVERAGAATIPKAGQTPPEAPEA